MKVFVTGGAGYIGQICVKLLRQRGIEVCVYDNLSTGHRRVLPDTVDFVEGDLRDFQTLAKSLGEYQPDAVMHLAGVALVPESMRTPELYFDVNTHGGSNLLRAMLATNIKRIIVSSTCAVYGVSAQLPIPESWQGTPINPYGASKRMFEQMLEWYAQVHQFRPTVFRYFNACGAWDELGEDHEPETHLIPNVLRVALGKKAHVDVFGTDYDTPDGSCLRDFIHVRDVAAAHLLAATTNTLGTFNLGTGVPVSVLQIVELCERVSGQPIPLVRQARRAGDPAALFADPSRAQAELGWQPEHSDIRNIIADAWAWHRQHPNGFAPS